MSAEFEDGTMAPTNEIAMLGDNSLTKAISGIAGAIGVGALSNKLGKGNWIVTTLGTLTGLVTAYKVIPEVVNDVQGGIESGPDLGERFKRVFSNLLNINGQTYTSSCDNSMDVD